MGLAAVDIAVVAVYGIFIFGLAQWVSREKAGHDKDARDYFLAGRSLPWWAIGSSLIAANISAEQIIGMSGSGYAIGIAVACYELMAAITLIIVGKFFLPIFLANHIYTMPQYLEQRYGPSVRMTLAVFWLGVYVFVNLTSILWLGAIAVEAVAGVDRMTALVALGLFAGTYSLYGGLKAVALTDIVQVALLVLGGLVIVHLSLNALSHDQGWWAGVDVLAHRFPDHFHLILSQGDPNYALLPGISVLVGGLWVMNLSYWGFNQYIIQRALAAKSVREAQKGVVFAAFLKLLIPVITVLPGIAALVLAPDITGPDQAYPALMRMLPVGFKGLVFAALVAAIVASLASKINSVATLFTLDLYAHLRPGTSQGRLVWVGRAAAALSVVIAIVTARPLLGGFDQAFQYIQEFTAFFTPGITVIFLLGMFWAGASTAGALTAAVGSAALSLLLKLEWPSLPFMDRVGVVFLCCLVGAVVASLLFPAKQGGGAARLKGVSLATSNGFNLAAGLVVLVVAALYACWW